MVLMDDDPAKIAKAIRISRKCCGSSMRTSSLPSASSWRVWCLWPGFANMWLAIFADVGVMILAVLNAIRATVRQKAVNAESAPSKAARVCPGVRRQSPRQRQPPVKREGTKSAQKPGAGNSRAGFCMYRPGQNAKSKCHFSKIEHGHDVPCLLVNSLEFCRELQLM